MLQHQFVDFGVFKPRKNPLKWVEKRNLKPRVYYWSGTKLIESEIVCYRMKYAYAMFLYHSIDKIYCCISWDRWDELGNGGLPQDISAWNSKHLVFQILKIKPKIVPICHFLVKRIFVWGFLTKIVTKSVKK